MSGNVGPRFIDISIRNINWRLLVSRITLFRTHVTRNRDEFGFHCVTTAKWMQTEFELAHTHSLFPSICAHPSNRFPFSDLERLEIVFSTDRMFFHRYYKPLDFNVFDFETKFLSCPKLDQITRKQSPLKQGPREQFSRKRRIPDASSPLINKSSRKGRKRKKERKGRIVNRVLPRRVGV